MEDTRCGKNCSFVKAEFCKNDTECPNYSETIWEEFKTGKIKTIKDCTPKRSMIEQQKMISAFNGVQASTQVLRDKIDRLEGLLIQIIQQSKTFFSEIEDSNAIEFKKNKNI